MPEVRAVSISNLYCSSISLLMIFEILHLDLIILPLPSEEIPKLLFMQSSLMSVASCILIQIFNFMNNQRLMHSFLTWY
jgi:hypothetical protein